MTNMREFMNLLPEEEQMLDEMPVQHFQTIGDFTKTSSFRKPEDMKLVNNPKAVAKVHKKFANSRYDFHFFFVNTKEVRDHVEIGQVSEEWCAQNMPEAWAEIKANINGDAINVIFTNNRGDERYPMTAWIIAHRLGHALRRSRNGAQIHPAYEQLSRSFESHLRKIMRLFGVQEPSRHSSSQRSFSDYARLSRNLFHQIGTMKSARDKNLRNSNEFLYEMIAQFLFIGEVRMNHVDGKLYSHSTWGHQQYRWSGGKTEEIDDAIDQFATEMTNDIDMLLGSVIGEIFVM
jgi:hypothetical protein